MIRLVTAIYADWHVSANRSEGVSLEEIVPDFWPVDIYNECHDEDAHPDQIRSLEYKSRTITNCYVPPDGRPLPPGCFKVSNFDRTSVDTKQIMETAGQQLEDNQAAATTAALRKRFDNSAEASAVTSEPKVKRKALKAVAPEDGDSPVQTRKKRRGGEASSSEEDGEDGFDFVAFSFPSNTEAKSKKETDFKKGKRTSKKAAAASPLKKGRAAMSKTKKSPKRKPAPRNSSSGAGTPSSAKPNLGRELGFCGRRRACA